jgi:hypothetical protein
VQHVPLQVVHTALYCCLSSWSIAAAPTQPRGAQRTRLPRCSEFSAHQHLTVDRLLMPSTALADKWSGVASAGSELWHQQPAGSSGVPACIRPWRRPVQPDGIAATLGTAGNSPAALGICQTSTASHAGSGSQGSACHDAAAHLRVGGRRCFAALRATGRCDTCAPAC